MSVEDDTRARTRATLGRRRESLGEIRRLVVDGIAVAGVESGERFFDFGQRCVQFGGSLLTRQPLECVVIELGDSFGTVVPNRAAAVVLQPGCRHLELCRSRKTYCSPSLLSTYVGPVGPGWKVASCCSGVPCAIGSYAPAGMVPRAMDRLNASVLRFSAGSTTAWYRVVMDASKIWSAGELEKMSPNERQSIVRAGFETDLSKVSPELLERTQRRIKVHISANQVATTPER